jgi:hypothetical protein
MKTELNVRRIKFKKKIQIPGFSAHPEGSSWSNKLSILKLKTKTAKIIIRNRDKKNSPES